MHVHVPDELYKSARWITHSKQDQWLDEGVLTSDALYSRTPVSKPQTDGQSCCWMRDKRTNKHCDLVSKLVNPEWARQNRRMRETLSGNS